MAFTGTSEKKSCGPQSCSPLQASKAKRDFLHYGVNFTGMHLPSAVFSSLLLLFHSQPHPQAVEWKGSLLAMPSSVHSRMEGDRPLQTGSPCMGRFPGSGWCPWPAPLPLCQSSPSPPPSQLSAPGPLCHSAPSLCLARGHIGMVPAGVCTLLWAASWNWVGVGRTPVPEAADHALASPSFLPGVNKSTGFQGAFKCVL